MVPREQEEWLLQQALAQGALQAGDLACVPGPSSLPSASSGIQYGPRIDLLVRRGCLDEHVVRGLLAEIAAQEVTCSGAGAADGEAVELPLAQAPSLIIPSYLQDWARYAIESCLGRGGMGVVYKAYDLSLERTVALKFMHGADLYTAQRFLREARAQARICHPAVCQVYEVAEYAGLPYIAMEYLPGQPLHLAFSSLSLEEKAYIVRDVALALQAAHGLGIIHRDIKPQNIVVRQLADGRWHAKVLDFGLARDVSASHALTESGALLGTPAYMPPEQVRGGGALPDRRADVYSLGAVLYYLLTGVPPFTTASLGEILVQVLHTDPVSPQQRNPRVPADLAMIVMKCLRKEVQLRYQSAQLVADELDRYLAGQPILASRWSWLYRMKRWAWQHRMGLGFGLLSALSLLCVLAVSVRGQRQADRRARLAHELGRESELNEMFLRAAYMMPLHSVRREQDEVRGRLRRLEQQQPRLDRTEAALAHLALGRGYLALRAYPQAVEHLQLALRDRQDDDDAHYALGLALGAQFQLARRDVERQGDPGWRQQRLLELQRQYLEPAQLHFRRVRLTRMESPEYAAGLQSYFDKDYAQALRQAEAAQRQQPWRAEYQKLIGDVLYSRALELIDRTAYAEARADLTQAVAAYQGAAAVARSDATLHLSEGDAWVKRMTVDMLQGRAPQAAAEQALAACARLAAVDPENEGLYQIEYFVHFTMAYYHREHGADPSDALAKALAATRQGTAVSPQNPFFYDAASTVRMLQVLQTVRRGEDPTALLDSAQELLQRALALNSKMARTWHALASLHALRFRLRTSKGLEARAEIQSALVAFQQARLLSQQTFAVDDALFILLSEYARSLLRRQESPLPALREAESWSATGAPQPLASFRVRQSKADLYAAQAEYALAHQQPAERELALAWSEVSEALRLNANDAACYLTLARVQRLRAQAAGQRGEPPTVLLSAALAAAERSLRINPADDAARRERDAVLAAQRRGGR